MLNWQNPIEAGPILDPFHDWLDGSECLSNDDCRSLECCSMGENEQTLLENRNIPITDEVREPILYDVFFL